MDTRAYFSGKKITVMGLGLLGRGVGDARYLAEQGAELIVTDLKSAKELATSVELLSGFPNVTLVLGEHRLEDFRDRDFILKAAGVPMDSAHIAEAHKNRIPVKMSASWFMELSEIPVIGVTGTRGKSTTTHMIHTILKAGGVEVLLGGNVRGVSTLALLDQITDDSVALFELDSWQLQGFGEAKLSPEISVFTTFLPDHMSYYHGDMDTYLKDKANIFLNQKASDTLILGAQCSELILEKYDADIDAHVIIAGAHDFRSDWTLKVPGEHNRYAAALAVEAARILDIDDEVIAQALADFNGVPGRLELVATKDGIDFYNDTTATTPDATLAALAALALEKKPVLLIMGGHDKGLDMRALLKVLPEQTKRVALLAGTGTDGIRSKFPDAPVFDSLADAVADVRAHAEAGDAIVLSPAFSSFGMFKNEYDRGDQFDAIVKGI